MSLDSQPARPGRLDRDRSPGQPVFVDDGESMVPHSRAGRLLRASQGRFDFVVDLFESGGGECDPVRRPLGAGRLILSGEGLDAWYYDSDDLLYLESSGCFRLLAEPAEGRARAVAPPGGREGWNPAWPSALMLPLIEHAKRRGFYSLQGACVARNGRGIILAGTSRPARRSLVSALMAGGFDLLATRLIGFTRIGPVLEASPFPREVEIVRKAVGGGDLESHFDHSEKGVEIPVTSQVAACTPAVILFPVANQKDRSGLRIMQQGEGLLELLPNVLLTDPHSSQGHLDTLGELVSQCECFRLEVGTDLGSLTEMVRRLVF